MAKNIILNIVCDEDQEMSFEEACPSNWQWLSYMLQDGGLPSVDLEDLNDALDAYVLELKKDQDAETEWLASVDEAVEQFKQRFSELVSNEAFDMGQIALMAGDWSVEYDHCFAVMIMDASEEDEE